MDSTTHIPLVTVITPTYNRADLLEETLQSVLQQDYPAIEYIVLDDGSSDNTMQLLEAYRGRVRVESHPNMGETRTVNRGFQLAAGKYVCVVNSDDPLLPGAIRTGVEILEARQDLLCVYPDWAVIDEKSRRLRVYTVPEYDYVAMVRRHDCMQGAAALVRRTAIQQLGGRNPRYRFVADFEFWLRLGLLGPSQRIPMVGGTFRVHSGSTSVFQRGVEMADEHIALVKNYFAIPGLPPEIREVKREAFARAHLHAARDCRKGSWASRWHYLLTIIYHPPTLRDVVIDHPRISTITGTILGIPFIKKLRGKQ